MSWMVMLTQVLLPLALLAWLAFYPASGWLAWGLQLISVTSVLLGIGLTGKALDIFRITPLGFHKNDWQPTDPARYTTFGVPVLSPCRGEVALVVDGIDDMPVPEMDRDHMAGNYVAINCGDFFAILAHLRQGSIAVVTGDKVTTGDLLGQIGNSGNSSEPHLHLHAQKGLPEEAPLSGEPLWITINNRFLVRNGRLSF